MMNNKLTNKLIAVLIALLIISMPVNAQSSAQDTQEKEETRIVELEIPEQPSELITEGEFTEFALIAKEYEPRILRSSLIEQNDVPVYIHLAAIQTDPFLTFPIIQPPLIVMESSNKTYFTGTINYHEPKIFSWDDIGYLEARLKKIPKEAEVPDNIKTTLKIKINYEAESAAGIISGTEQKQLEFRTGITKDNLFESDEYSFFGRRGFVTVENIGTKSASYNVYDENGQSIGILSSSTGAPSSELRIIKTSEEPEDIIRIRTDEISDYSKSNIKIKIDNQEKLLNFGSKIRGWYVSGINLGTKQQPVPYLTLYKPGIGKLPLFEDASSESIDKITIGDIRKIYPQTTNTQFGLMKKNYQVLKKDFGKFEILEFNQAAKTKAILEVGGSTMQIEENQLIPGTECSVTGIGIGTVQIRYPVETASQGKTVKSTSTTALRIERFEEEEIPVYQPETAQPAITYYLPYDICGQKITLKDIDFKKSVTFTILSGRRRGTAETTLTINIPIEKKPWDPSPRTIDKLINRTEKQIQYLDEKIAKLEKTVTSWRKVCLATAAVFTVWSFISGYEPQYITEEKENAEKRKTENAKIGGESITLIPDKSKICGESYNQLDGLYASPSALPADKQPIYILNKTYEGPYYIGKQGKCERLPNAVVYDAEGTSFIYSAKENAFKQYTGLDKKEFGQIRTVIINGDSAVIVPIKDFTRLPSVVRKQYEEWKTAYDFKSQDGLYAVYKENEIQFWQGFGKPDAGNRIEKDTETDRHIVSYSKDSTVYKEFTVNYINRIKDAQKYGLETLDIGSDTFKINPRIEEISTSRLSCTEVMSESQCILLYNACDPVMCPPSRCNLGGIYTVQSVIKSGLIGSIILCLPNFPETLTPVCLTGILASLKNIRSYLKDYVKCLQIKKAEGKSVGICERIRSIYMCEIIWKEVMPLFIQLARKVSTAFSSAEGSEYITPLDKSLKSAENTLDFFTRDYAKEIFAAYQAKTTEEIGLEFCKAAIGGRLPNFGEFVDELASPEDPYQYTAWVEEHDYSATKSSYQVYYHIYAGKPKIEETINYQVVLRSKTKPPVMIAQGILKSEDSVDETKEIIQDKGYDEICVTVNREIQCGFGKVISTSYGIQQIIDKYVAPEKKITKTKDCISGQQAIAGVAISLIPSPSVQRQCSSSNPYLGLGEKKEAEWQAIGECYDDDGTYRGICWLKLNTEQHPEIEEASAENVCTDAGLELCEKYQKCIGGVVISEFAGRQCCQAGTCTDIMKDIKINSNTISQEIESQIDILFKADNQAAIREYVSEAEKNGGEFPTGESILLGKIQIIRKSESTKNQFYYITGLTYLKYARIAEAEDAFNQISKDSNVYISAMTALKDIYKNSKEWEKISEMCSKEQIPKDNPDCTLAIKSIAEKKLLPRLSRQTKCESAIKVYDDMITKKDIEISSEINAQAYFLIGKTCLFDTTEEKRFEKAKIYLSKVTVALLKNQAEYYYYSSLTDYCSGDSNSAKSLVEKTKTEDIAKTADNDLKEKIVNLNKFLQLSKDYAGLPKESLEPLKTEYTELNKKANIDAVLKSLIEKEIQKINTAIENTRTSGTSF